MALFLLTKGASPNQLKLKANKNTISSFAYLALGCFWLTNVYPTNERRDSDDLTKQVELCNVTR